MREGDGYKVASVKRVPLLLKILRAENLKMYENSAIIYIESERDVTPLLINILTGRPLPSVGERGTK